MFDDEGNFKKDDYVTRVSFRVWLPKEYEEDVIAFFPDQDEGRGLCMCYEHVGQHGGADYLGLLSQTRLATPEEYADLKRELESYPYGYNFKVIKRWTR